MTLYGGAACYYTTAGSPIGAGADALVTTLDLDGTRWLLDVACEPGSLTLLLARPFSAAISVDADGEVLGEAYPVGRRAADRQSPVDAVRAEELPADPSSHNMMSFAQSFHSGQGRAQTHRISTAGGPPNSTLRAYRRGSNQRSFAVRSDSDRLPPMDLRNRLDALGLVVPPAVSLPPSVVTTFAWVRPLGDRVLVSGHGPVGADGAPVGPFGRVPDQVHLDEAQESAKLTAASVIANVERAIGDLSRIDAWVSVSGFVQTEPGYSQTTAVLNAFSEVVLAVFGPEVGEHARTAIGVSALPLNLPVIVAAELHLAN